MYPVLVYLIGRTFETLTDQQYQTFCVFEGAEKMFFPYSLPKSDSFDVFFRHYVRSCWKFQSQPSMMAASVSGFGEQIPYFVSYLKEDFFESERAAFPKVYLASDKTDHMLAVKLKDFPSGLETEKFMACLQRLCNSFDPSL